MRWPQFPTCCKLKAIVLFCTSVPSNGDGCQQEHEQSNIVWMSHIGIVVLPFILLIRYDCCEFNVPSPHKVTNCECHLQKMITISPLTSLISLSNFKAKCLDTSVLANWGQGCILLLACLNSDWWTSNVGPKLKYGLPNLMCICGGARL